MGEVEEQEEQMEVDDHQEQAGKKQLKLTYEEYKKMSNVIIHHIRQKEEVAEASASETPEDVKKSDVINWYLEEISGDIESQEELTEKKQIVEKVVDRLIYQDRVIIPLQKTGLKSSATTEDGENDPYLVVHPNYLIDA